jgi:FkbM family methyltransferase
MKSAQKMAMALGNMLFTRAFPVYRALYWPYKLVQDKYLIQLMRQVIRPGDTALDIGANIGFYTLKLARLVGKEGRVMAFEPDDINFARLQGGTSACHNVRVYPHAVAAKDGQLTMYTSDQLNVDHRTYKPPTFQSSYPVQAISLDSFLTREDRVHFIKMDIQGYEMEALKGMQTLLSTQKSISMVSECWPAGLKLAGSSASAYIDALQALDFRIVLLLGGQQVPVDASVMELFEQCETDTYYNIFATRSR